MLKWLQITHTSHQLFVKWQVNLLKTKKLGKCLQINKWNIFSANKILQYNFAGNKSFQSNVTEDKTEFNMIRNIITNNN